MSEAAARAGAGEGAGEEPTTAPSMGVEPSPSEVQPSPSDVARSPSEGSMPPADLPTEPPAESVLPLDQVLAAGRVVTWPLCAVAGLLVGVLGTAVHRAASPWGLVIALLAVLSGAVLARALAHGPGLAIYAGALLLVTQVMSQVRPGGDVVIAGDALGHTWLYGSVLTVAVAAFLPARWFGPPARPAP